MCYNTTGMFVNARIKNEWLLTGAAYYQVCRFEYLQHNYIKTTVCRTKQNTIARRRTRRKKRLKCECEVRKLAFSEYAV